MNETLQTIKARRSVRAYMEQQVSAEDLNLILEAATYAPNGMHLETWHFTAIQNKEVLKELNDKIKGAFAKSDDPHTIFLAAKSLGIGSCWINQLGQTCDDPDVRAFLTKLGVPESHKVYGCAALGYAPADAPVKEKKVKEGTVTIIR